MAVAPLARATESPLLDVRLVVDVSAAMTSADPKGFRAEAVQLLARLLPGGASAGVWTYARFVNLLVPHGEITADWRERAVTATRSLPDVGSAANLVEALRQASWDGPAGSARSRHIILMTDGRLATGGDARADEAALAGLAAFASELKRWGIRVHVLRLPGAADPLGVKQLAMATNGHYLALNELGGLNAAVQTIGESLGASDVSALPIKGQAFQVDPGVEELTVLRLRDHPDPALAVVDPAGRVVSRSTASPMIRWHEEQGYDLLTISKPRSGRWHFARGAQTGSRVYAASDIELHFSGLPATVFPGALHSFQLDLKSDGRPIADEDFLRMARVSAVMETTGGEKPILVEALGGGRYLLKLFALDEQGEHRVRVTVAGPTFERQRRVTFVVRNPVSLDIVPGAGAAAQATAWISLNTSEVDFDSLAIVGLAKQPPQAATQISALRRPGGLWKFDLPAAAGALELVLDIKGNYLNGMEFLVKTEPVVLTLPLPEPLSINMDLSGARILGTGAITPTRSKLVAPGDEPPPPSPVADATATDPDETVLPGWFAALIGFVNLLAGFGVYFLMRPTPRPDPFFESLAALEELLPEEPVPA